MTDDQPALTPGQTARAEALHQARMVLASGKGPLNGGEAPDADTLIHTARWIIQGDRETDESGDPRAQALIDRMATLPEDETRRLMAEAGWLHYQEEQGDRAVSSPHIRAHPTDRDDNPQARRVIWDRKAEAWVGLTGPLAFLRDDPIPMGYLLNYREQTLEELAGHMADEGAHCGHRGPRIGDDPAYCVLPEGHSSRVAHRAHPTLGEHAWS